MKFKIKTKFVLILVVFCTAIIGFSLVKADSSPETREGNILIEKPGQNGSFFISVESAQNETVSPILRADFTFNALFLGWEYDEKLSEPDIYVRFLNEGWGEWKKVEIDEDTGKDEAATEIFSQMIATKSTDTFQYKISFANNEAKKSLKNLKLTYLDTTKGPSGNIKIASNNNNLQITSRKNWGADENYRYDTDGNELWPEDYYTPKRFIIHHTAGEDANVNPMATLRAIYYWHSKGRGWGDIGYNYLIDSKGNIYEGRNGGDGVVGGHALSNNRSSIGIAILGCYDNQANGACNTPDKLTDAAQTALNNLIAQKSREFNIDPNSTSEYNGKMMANILGHRDVGKTTCPGSIVYSALTQTRQLAYNILQGLGGYKKTLPTSAEFVKASAKEINIQDTKTAEVTIEFKNTGQETWRGYEDNYVYIADASVKKKLTKINSVKTAIEAGDKDSDTTTNNAQIFKLTGGNVAPGEIGEFKLTLNSPTSAKEIKNFVLAWSDKGYFSNSDFAITINKIACTTNCNSTQNSANTATTTIYTAELSSSGLPARMEAKSTQTVSFQFKNTGNKSWLAKKLKLTLASGKTQQEVSNTEVIASGAIATLKLNVKAPDSYGPNQYTITLSYDNKELLKTTQSVVIFAPYSAEITANDIPASITANTRQTVTLTFKNTGSKTWATGVTLKSTDIDGTNSWFKDWTWPSAKIVAKNYNPVKPGESVTFKFKILAYWKAGTYPQVFKISTNGNDIYFGAAKEYKTTTKITAKTTKK